MKRKPTFAPYIGSIRSASHPDDLIPNLAAELDYLLKHCRVDRETRKVHAEIIREVRIGLVNKDHLALSNDAYMLPRLVEALSHYAPPYTYFGERDGDYGFWPEDFDDSDLPRLPDGVDQPSLWGAGDVLLVNDHGNVECGRFDKRGRFHSYWSAV